MSLSKKLVVTISDDTIYLTGIMDEGMNIFGLKEAFKGDFTTVDFSRVSSASWNSLLRFDELLKDTGINGVTLACLPYSIYKFFRMIAGFDSYYHVISLEVPILEFKTRTIYSAKFNCGSPETRAILNGSLGDKNEALFGRFQHFHALFHSSVLANTWSTSELSDVALDYALFCEVIMALVYDIAVSVRVSIGASIREFESQTLAIEKGIKVAGLGEDSTSIIDDLKKVLTDLKPDLALKASAIAEILEPCQDELNAIAAEALSCMAEYKPFPLDLLPKIVAAIRTVIPVLTLAEDFGIGIGQLYNMYDLKKIEKPYLAALASKQMSAAEIKDVIDIYCIMDPLADDQKYLVENVRSYFQNIDNEIAKISTLSQGCDLVRQILEHRINESQVIEDFARTRQINTDLVIRFRNDLITMIKKRMVTDQEKFAVRFYMPEEVVVEQETARPGEMFMF